MGGGHEMTRNLRKQEPGWDDRFATAAGTSTLAQGKGRAKRAGLYLIQPEGGEPFTTQATRLAVTREQADRLGLPTAPPKPTDKRRFTGDTVQCEAIAPDVLVGILRDAIEARRNPDTARAVLALEADFRAALMAKLGGAQ